MLFNLYGGFLYMITSRLKKVLEKTAMSINDFPQIITGNDVKLELISQFDWFNDIPKEQLDNIIDNTSEKDFQQIANEINNEIIPEALNDPTIKAFYMKEFGFELRWLVARALYVDKFDVIIQLMNNRTPLDPIAFGRPLLLSDSLYTPSKLRQLQDQNPHAIRFCTQSKLEGQPFDKISDSQLAKMIKEAHEVAIQRTFHPERHVQNRLALLAQRRLDIHTNEFWINHNIRK